MPIRILPIILFLMVSSPTVFAQRFAYVDLEYILNKIPEFKAAQAELNALVTEWQKEEEKKQQFAAALFEKYQAESMLMSDAMKKERQLAIKNAQKAAQEYQTKVFGPNGLLFLKRQELIVPLQKKIFQSVERIAKNYNYQMVFDKSAGMVMIYTDPVYDLTDKILEELGLKEPQEQDDESEQF